jgi:hypothetical protein
MCRAKTVPVWALNEFRDLFPGKRIEFYAHQSIGAVLASDQISLFVPLEVLTGQPVEATAEGKRQIIPPDVKGVQQWIKTKMGYVPANARIAVAAMRRRCIGEFAKPLI